MATLLGRMRHIKAYWVTGTLISLTVSAFAVVQSCLHYHARHHVSVWLSEAAGFAKQVGIATTSAIFNPSWDSPSP